MMNNRTLVEKIIKNLSFEVEAIPNNKIALKTSYSSKVDPMTVKIKVRKKEINEQYHRGFISNNQSEPEKTLQNIRFISSQETIMSFDMFMEAEGKEISRNSRKHIFDRIKPGICLGATTDDDDQPYMPNFNQSINASQSGPISKSYGKLRQQFTLTKTSPTKRTERTFLGSKCKPGGCLDPPFGEDTYSYKPFVQDIQTHVQSNTSISLENGPIDAKFNAKDTDSNKKKSKDPFININDVNIDGQKSDSVLSLYTVDSKRKSSKSYSPNDKNYSIKNIVGSEEKLKQPINDSMNAFFSPPKGIKKHSNNYVQRDSLKRHSYNPKSIKNKPTEYLPIPDPITVSLNSLPLDQNSTSKIIDNIDIISNTQNAVPSSKHDEEKQTRALLIPIEVDKDLNIGNNDYVDLSYLIGDIKNISTASNSLNYVDIDKANKTSYDVDKPRSSITHTKVIIPITNQNESVLNECQVDINANPNKDSKKENLSDTNNINTEKEPSNTLIESVMDQSNIDSEITSIRDNDQTDIKSKINHDQVDSDITSTRDKDKTDIKSNINHEQINLPEVAQDLNGIQNSGLISSNIQIKNQDMQSSNMSKKSVISSDLVFKDTNLNSVTKIATTTKEMIEILTISDNKSNLEKNTSKILEPIKKNTNNTDITKQCNNEKNDKDILSLQVLTETTDYAMIEEQQIEDTDMVIQKTSEPREDQEINVKIPKEEFIVSQDKDTSSNKTNLNLDVIKIVDANLSNHEKNMTDKDNVLPNGKMVSPIHSNRIENTVPEKVKNKSETTLTPSDDLVTTDLRTISLNFAFHSYVNNNNERIVKTIVNEEAVKRCPNDSVTVINSYIKVSTSDASPELNIPIDSMLDMSIKLKNASHEIDNISNKSKTRPFSNFLSSVKPSTSTDEKRILENKVHKKINQNDTIAHRTLSDIYETELIPLQKMIKALKTEIDVLTAQKTLFKKNVICLKKSPQ